jgi:hypothetical protein
VITLLGWSIHIKCDFETVLYAESQDWSLDHKIREQASRILDSADYPEWGYGYPNRYLIRNDQLPQARLYRYTDKTVSGDKFYRVQSEVLMLGPLPDIPADKLLWVELWDQS